ncbi:DUF2637 domain-containing protein [Nocardia sp. CA-120079]|uniref:DUF2637 domain-containing protein n=1 Tax=Nocardia sp. CA-120079 TaxID=3239974 RepID=UPI003D955D54
MRQAEFAAAVAGVRQCGWALLAFWAVASVAANGVHAWLKQGNDAALPPWAAAGFGVLAPLALLGVTELIARLLRLAQVTRGSRLVYVALALALIGAVGLAAAAFRLSFAALAEFGEMCGVPTGLAWLVPCVVDGAILVADVAVVAASTAARLAPRAIPEVEETVPAPAPVVKASATRVPVNPEPAPVAVPALAARSAPEPVQVAAPPTRAPNPTSASTVDSPLASPAPRARRAPRTEATTAPHEQAPAATTRPHTPRIRPTTSVRTELRDEPSAERPRIRMVTPRLTPARG